MPRWCSTSLASAIQVSHRSATTEKSGTLSTSCNACARREVGMTMRLWLTGGSNSASRSARAPSVGCS